MFRSYFVEDTANPWSPSSTYIQVGSLQNILTFAEKSGHIDRRNVNIEEIRRKVDTNSPSVALIRLLREITRLGKALDKVNLEIQCHLKEAETKDVTHVDILGRRCHHLEQISGQLSAIIEKKDELISRLQQPFVGEFLEIDAAHHKNTAEVLPMISSDLASFPTLLENIAWIRNFSLADGQLMSVLSSIESSFAEIQSFYQALCQSRNLMSRLQEEHVT
ncbi:hypothetical protein OS493_029091 [Desmophyllum pertusum]|uniref:HAUS augmin-like complex subunit 2 n=1 Tax=Desmophyllum pertusum TaxID=174260 RepID=A0A9W9Y8X9_9CNID|nr:hypothetical protein OS493_029091 [Desmophyllum pertusum]